MSELSSADLDAYAAGLASAELTARVERELQRAPGGEVAQRLARLGRLLADPFAIDWGAVAGACAGPAEAGAARRAVEAVVAEVEAGRGRGLSLADNRALTEEALARLAGAGGVGPEAVLAAGEALYEVQVERARRQPPAPGAEETADLAATTLPAADRAPGRVLEMDRRLGELAGEPDMVRAFVLAQFAGRTPAEIAGLLGLPQQRVEEALVLARAHALGAID